MDLFPSGEQMIMKPHRLDAILPVCNGARCLEAVVQDLLSAKDAIGCDLRLIIVYGGSTGGTGAACRRPAAG
jgi:hypothetical protein